MKLGKKLMLLLIGILSIIIIFKASMFLLGLAITGFVSSIKLLFILFKFILLATISYIVYKIIDSCVRKKYK